MRLIICILSLLIASTALADWKMMFDSDSSTHYMDPTTIRKDGELRRVWEIIDSKVRHKKYGYLYHRYRIEYDCQKKRSRILFSSLHTGPLASGTIRLSDDNVEAWLEIEPETIEDSIFKVVCSK